MVVAARILPHVPGETSTVVEPPIVPPVSIVADVIPPIDRVTVRLPQPTSFVPANHHRIREWQPLIPGRTGFDVDGNGLLMSATDTFEPYVRRNLNRLVGTPYTQETRTAVANTAYAVQQAYIRSATWETDNRYGGDNITGEIEVTTAGPLWDTLEVHDYNNGWATNAATGSAGTYTFRLNSSTTANNVIMHPILNSSTAGSCVRLVTRVINGRQEFELINDPVEEKRYQLQVKQSSLKAKIAPPRRVNHHGKDVRAEYSTDLFAKVSPREIVALQLLRKMIPTEMFRKYLTHGFVTVTGPSGLVYQIGRDQRIKVWALGDLLCTLCVHLRDPQIPPTDEVVAKMLMAEIDEPELWKRSNMSWLSAKKDRTLVKQLGLAA